MRKFCTFLLTMVVAIVANAAINPTVQLGDEFKSVKDLEGKVFVIANLDDQKALYGPNNQNLEYGAFDKAFQNTNSGYLWQIESLAENDDASVHDYFLIRLVRPDGTVFPTSDWGGRYLNSQDDKGWCCFNLGLTAKKLGQDIDYGAVWDIQYVEGKGFTLKNIGTGLYKGANTGTANVAEENAPGFAFCPVTTTYVPALKALLAEGEAMKANGASSTEYDEAIAGIDPETTTDALADAQKVEAALPLLVKSQSKAGSDFTRAIANFECGAKDGWTFDKPLGGNGPDYANGFEYWAGNASNRAEASFDYYQEITGLPNGTYTVGADMYNSLNNEGGAYTEFKPTCGVYATVGETTVSKLVDVNSETQVPYVTDAIEVTDGTIRIGVKSFETPMAARWFTVKNFKLTLVEPAAAPVPAEDAWFTDNTFCIKDAANGISRSMDLPWAVDPDDASNGCIKLSSAANAGNDHDLQFMIRGAEYDGSNLMNGAFAEGTGFKVTFKVKADGNYSGCLVGTFNSIAAEGKDGWKFGNYLENQAVKMDVTTEWQTVSYSYFATADDAGKFTAIGFNLAEKGGAARTFYFDDVQIERGSEWYLNNEFHAKDYYKENEEDPDPVYSDSDNPHPLARFVADAEGGYVEVVTNAARNNPWDSQIWIGIPSEYVGKITKMTMQVWADESVTCSESYHATATGKGWGASVSPGTGLVTEADKWVDITRILNTKNVMCNGVYTNKQVDYYCLDLSNDAQNTGDGVVYRFRNIKFDKAAEDWYTNNEITVDGAKALYIYGDGEEGGYVEVAGGKSLVFGIPANLQGGDVKISMKVKAAAEDATTDIIYTTEWADASIIVEAAEATYTLALPAEGTFDFDEVAFEKYYKPIDYGELIGIPVEGTLVKEVDFTTATSWTHSPSWAQNKEGYTDKLIIGEGLEIVNNADQGMWESQFFILENAPLVADKDYAVRYTLKYDGEGGDMQINLQAGDWSTNNQAVYPLAAGPIYTQMVHIAKGWTGNGNANVFFQSGAIKGRMIVEKVEVFDITPKYDEMAWTDNILVNGDLEGEDMNEFVGKIVKGDYIYDGEGLPTDEYVYEDLDPETLLLEAEEYVEGWDQEQAGEAGPNGLVISVAEWPEGTGNDYDSQFFLRLPKALPKGTVFKLEFDYAGSNAAVSSVIAAHAEPGKWQANFTKSIKPADEWAWTHFEEFLTAPEDMRAIAINLGSKNGGVYLFDNFSVKVDEAKAADIEELTADWDLNWAETLALNEKIHEAKGYDNEEGQYTEESFSALQTAITDAKTVAKNAEAAKDDIVAATSDVQDAIDGLKAPKTLLPAPETDPDYADFEEITQDQGITLDGNPRAVVTDCGTYTNYSASEDLSVAFKITNIDVEGCDYVTVKFATAIPDGWVIAFGKLDDLTTEAIPAGSSEFKKQLADVSSIQDDVLPQITILTLWGAQKPLELDVYGVYKHKVAPELSYTDLTQDMFFQWTDWTDADPVANAGCAYDVNVESGQPYGDSNVINYADLSEYATLEVTTPAGTAVQPRFLFNRDVNEGQDNEVEENAHLIDMPKFAWSEKYQSVKENVDGSKTYVIDIAAIVADKGYAHLHAIKALGWGNSTTVTDMKLGYYGEKPSIPIPTAINAVAEGGEGAALKDGKYFVDGQTIIVKNGKKYTVAGVEIK